MVNGREVYSVHAGVKAYAGVKAVDCNGIKIEVEDIVVVHGSEQEEKPHTYKVKKIEISNQINVIGMDRPYLGYEYDFQKSSNFCVLLFERIVMLMLV